MNPSLNTAKGFVQNYEKADWETVSSVQHAKTLKSIDLERPSLREILRPVGAASPKASFLLGQSCYPLDNAYLLISS